MLRVLFLSVAFAVGLTACGKTCTVDDDDDGLEDTGLDSECYLAGYDDFVAGAEYDPAASGCGDYEDAYEEGWCQATEDEGLFDPEC